LIIASAQMALVAPVPTSAAIIGAYASATREPVAPGVSHDQGRILTTAGSQAVNIVEVDPANPAISFEASLSNGRVAGLERTTTQAVNRSSDGHRVVAAINGDVWAGSSNFMEQAPNGLHVEAGELVTAVRAARPTFGVGADGRPMLGSPVVSVTLTTSAGTQFVISRVNQFRRPSEVVLYTPRFGGQTSTAATGIDIVVGGLALPLRMSGTWTGVVAAIRPAEGGWPIDPGTAILTAPSTSSLAALAPGEPVTLTAAVTAGWESVQHAVGGREWIVRDGAVNISPHPASADQLHARSAIGLTADGRLILIAVDGGRSGSRGMRLPELGDLMLSRGAVNAINLDGGGSTALAVRRAGTPGPVLVSRPEGSSERSVTNSIQVISNVPTGPLSSLSVQPGSGSVYRNGTVNFTSRGMDSGYNPAPLTAGQVAWSVTAPIGTIDAAGRFLAMAPGTGQVVATANGVTGSATITVLDDSTAPVAAPPRVSLPVNGVIGSGVTLSIAWDPATDSGSGVASYELQRSVNGKAWTTMPKASAAALSTTLTMPRDRTYQFQVRDVQFIKGTWSPTASKWLDGGTARTTRSTGGIAQFTFTGSSVAWVAAVSPLRGAADVFIDGAFAGNVNTNRSTSAARLIVFSRTWPTSAQRTIEIRTLGTPGNPRVDLDAFVVLTPASAVTPAPTPTPSPTPAPTAGPTPTPSPTPPASAGVVLVGAGDIASCGLTADSATAKVVAGIAGTVFTAGDNAYELGSAAEFRDCYGPTWGAFRDRTYPAPGNHDYGTSGAGSYFSYFGARAGPVAGGWYAYDLGDWRIYSLNSNCAEVGCAAGSQQEQWLRADLAALPRACVLAYWHHPRFSSGQHGNGPEVGPLWNALYDAGAEVVINGHDHDYERFAPQTPAGAADPARGIRQFVVGTGGASLRGFSTTRANSEVRNSTTFGVLKLTLSSGSYAWQFVPAGSGTFTDSGTGTCR
ncbi:MAG: Metallophosphoesterase, partial [Chloroflexi bacterium]|nr:Metallophosphoesterase [Chloroflexota bacterium]